jgi:hypothetical protein
MPSTPRLHISTISLPTFGDKLKAYDGVRDRVAPSKKSASSLSLADLDHERYTLIPDAVAGRRQQGGDETNPGLSKGSSSSSTKTSSGATTTKETSAPNGLQPYITKAELTSLMDWKLTHGTFRPALRGLVAQNDDHTVETVTRDGLALWPDVKASIKKLSELRGVGPATASLLLSVAYPEDAPFFSDELFCWAMADYEKGEVDWRRKIKYSVAEYLEVVEAAKTVDDRLWHGGIINGGGLGHGPDGKIWAVMCEKVAFVLGNGGWFDDVVEEFAGGDDVEAEDAKPEVSSETSTEEPVAGNKRKRNDTSIRNGKDNEETPPSTKTKGNPTRRNPARAKRP